MGYSGIKVQLPTTLASSKCYLQLYIEQILALQALSNAAADLKGDASRHQVPLAIMVSDDTKALTEELLRRHNNFGMSDSQITLLKQEKVPALMDLNATVAREGKYGFVSKPHGHGDVHALLHNSGLVKKWNTEGRKFVTFFQVCSLAGVLVQQAARKASVV